MLISFIPMYLIAVAYQELNKAEPDCGTTFTWASRAFGPIVGWLGGWGIIVADVIVMANLVADRRVRTRSPSSATWAGIRSADLANSTFWSTVAGVIWIVVMTYICYRGIEVSARLQYVSAVHRGRRADRASIVALVKVYTGNAEAYSLHPSLSWFWPGGLDFGTIIAPAVLTAIFIYWGWDTAVACNEESDDPGRTPGRAAVISTFLLLVTYAMVTVVGRRVRRCRHRRHRPGQPATTPTTSSLAIGPDLFGNSVLGHIGLAAAVGLDPDVGLRVDADDDPADRAHHAVDGGLQGPPGVVREDPPALPDADRLDDRRWASSPSLFYVLFTLISANLLTALIGSVGLMIAFYYGLTGFACVWFYRKTLTESARDFVMRGVVPLLGGIVLLPIVFIYGLIQYAKTGLADRRQRQQRHDPRLRRRRGRRYRRADARRDPDGRLVGDGPGLLPRPHPDARQQQSGFRCGRRSTHRAIIALWRLEMCRQPDENRAIAAVAPWARAAISSPALTSWLRARCCPASRNCSLVSQPGRISR